MEKNVRDNLEQFIKKLSGWDKILILRQKSCPTEFVEILTDKAIRKHNIRNTVEWLAKCPNFTIELQDKIMREASYDDKMKIAALDPLPPHMAEILAEDKDPRIRHETACNKSCSAECLAKLAATDDMETLALVSNNPNCSRQTLENICSEADAKTKLYILDYRIYTKVLYEILAYDSNPEIREKVAQHLHCADEKLFEVLSDDTEEKVRQTVARNRNTPQYILDKLLNDTSDNVRAALASSTKDMEVLEKLINNSSAVIRAGAAVNGNITYEMFEKLKNDPDKKVAAAAKKTAKAIQYDYWEKRIIPFIKELKSITKSMD